MKTIDYKNKKRKTQGPGSFNNENGITVYLNKNKTLTALQMGIDEVAHNIKIEYHIKHTSFTYCLNFSLRKCLRSNLKPVFTFFTSIFMLVITVIKR